MENNSYDFGGWATKSNIECSDGRTILPNAFKHNNGKKVPLVWNHKHNDVNNVLGHAMLENRDDGVYAYCTFNETETAQNAKTAVEHGDIVALSIHANKLKQMGSLVSHGEIREVSLVLAGANPGAYIDSIITHGEDGEEEAIIYNDAMLEMAHSENVDDKIDEELHNDQVRLVNTILAGSMLKHGEKLDAGLIKTGDIITDMAELEDAYNSLTNEQLLALNHAIKGDEDEDDKENATHSEDKDLTVKEVINTYNDDQKGVLNGIMLGIMAQHGDVDLDDADTKNIPKSETTIKEVLESMSDIQLKAMQVIIADLSEEYTEAKHSDESEETVFEDITHSVNGEYNNNENLNNHEGESKMPKTNVFENTTKEKKELTHADGANIVDLAKSKAVGSLQDAIDIYMEHSMDGEDDEKTLSHAFEDITELFPDFKDVRPGMPPELITRDETWVGQVISKVHKSPISRIRNRYTDARGLDVRAKGYTKGDEKTNIGNIKLLNRTTDPQTIYVKDKLHRDDIIDTVDFDYVAYNYKIMQMALNEELAIATMVGDGREDGADYKIEETHIRSVWNDDELYTIHKDVDFEAAEAALQGTGTGASFGEGFVQSEAIIEAALYAREGYKGSGSLEFYCTPHLVNVMLLARDMNGRRMYDSKADLAKALNVVAIHEAEQFEGLTRTDKDNKVHELLGIFVNLKDYQYGCTKGGQVTKFRQFDIDFNAEKMLIETRLSGALTRIKSAIALEKDVTPTSSTSSDSTDTVG